MKNTKIFEIKRLTEGLSLDKIELSERYLNAIFWCNGMLLDI
jgi:hypothetical protein